MDLRTDGHYFPMQQLNYRNIIQTQCIYCAVHIESLNIIQKNDRYETLVSKVVYNTKSVADAIYHDASSPSVDITVSYRVLHDPTYSINPELSYVPLSIFHPMSKHLLLLDIRGFSVSLTARGEILCKHLVPFLNLMLPRISFRRRWFGAYSISYFRLLPIGCNVQFAADNCIMVPSVQQKSRCLKFSKSRSGTHVTYSCHHNSNRF
jgi:hypothetical protein